MFSALLLAFLYKLKDKYRVYTLVKIQSVGRDPLESFVFIRDQVIRKETLRAKKQWNSVND